MRRVVLAVAVGATLTAAWYLHASTSHHGAPQGIGWRVLALPIVMLMSLEVTGRQRPDELIRGIVMLLSASACAYLALALGASLWRRLRDGSNAPTNR